MPEHRPFSVRGALLGAGALPERLRNALDAAAAFLTSCSPGALVDSVLEQAPHRSAVRACVTDVGHAGFLVPGGTEAEVLLPALAAVSAFAGKSSVYPSAIVSRELGTLMRGPPVATQIFRAHARASLGENRYVEIFIPNEREDVVRPWIDREVATHVGLTLRSAGDLPAARAALEAEGFHAPNFMSDGPMRNKADGTCVLYLDRELPRGQQRIELISFEGPARWLS